MKWLAPAKINLSLRILGKRPDGFHSLETLMVPLSLTDEITFQAAADLLPGGSFELTCSDASLPTGSENLAVRAAEAFRARAKQNFPSLRISLQKGIPHGAGLGGGSSDAATVLLALNTLVDQPLQREELVGIAAGLGSDVPFFLAGGAAVCRGRGELVEPVAFSRTVPLLLLKPAFPVPTPWAYSRWKAARELPGVHYAPQDLGWVELVNDLERPVFEKFLILAEIKMWLLGRPEVAGALLSGSGSTMLAVLHEAEDATAVVDAAVAEFGPLWSCVCETGPATRQVS